MEFTENYRFRSDFYHDLKLHKEFNRTTLECSLFFRLLQAWTLGVNPEPPALVDRRPDEYTLPELELQCRRLDLYYSFSRSFGVEIDADALYDEREQIAERINTILLHNLKNNIRFCKSCGAALPLHHQGRLCAKCFRGRPGFRRY